MSLRLVSWLAPSSLFVGLFFTSLTVWAQVSTGEFVGRVIEPGGAVLPGVLIEVKAFNAFNPTVFGAPSPNINDPPSFGVVGRPSQPAQKHSVERKDQLLVLGS